MEHPLVEEKLSRIHGYGVFAKCDIPAGTKIIEYVGTRLSKEDAEDVEDTRYLFEINKEYDLDGNVWYNLARFINHTCEPNCETENEDDRIWIIAKRDIKAGEELSYNYGYGLEDYQDWPCNCGKVKCVGYMLSEEDWDKIKKPSN